MVVKVLILEDDTAARSLLCRVVLESFSDDIRIAEAGDLETARRLIAMPGDARGPNGAQLKVDPFRLVLIDLQLLDGDGIELLTELAHYPATDRATRIAIARNSDDDQVFRALKHGVDGYLLMLDGFDALMEELQKIVRGQPPLSAAIARLLLSHFGAGAGAGGSEAPLTPREVEILTYLSKGFTAKEVAILIGWTWYALNDQVKSIYRKLSRGPDDDGAQEIFNAPKPPGGGPLAAEAARPTAKRGSQTRWS